ncbi:hypothetical protein CAI21_05805 [Alkalilimnicola ehrlichii]|uniref:hypothetical protein n=1 Tax=Alkalilimnicola ehrlichii TaxID=351052 RepID=UPI000E2EE4CF|nr:hypothetical protein [Alkalilimnicola ehrlichii]RFA30558.1 hypothetical protein CAI21_05805 [Alkalilimnicola ehrlichii]
MDSLQPNLSATPAVLTVELDMRAVAAGARPPAPLSPNKAEKMAHAIAADLEKSWARNSANTA